MNFVTSKKGKRILLISFLGLAVIAILIAVMLSRNQEGYRTIKVSEISGKVGVVNNGIEYEAYPGMIVKEGYAIVTSSDSYVRMVLDGDKYIKLEGGSRIVFEKLGILGSGKTTIKLERGTITNEIVHPLGEDEDYIINTPNAVLAVRGTFFKVSLKVTDEGDTTTDVLTYGGAVTSKRVMPNGNIVDEEVVVDSGYMTTVKMSNEETIYVVESTDSERENTVPIVKEMISDEDLIDIYFASENGHEMFIPKEEIEEEIKGREIDIKEHTSVYKKAENLEKENVITSPDDGEPLVREEETETIVQGPSAPSDGGHKHKETETIVEATCTTDGKITISCSTCGELLSESVIVAKGHTEGAPTTIKEATCTADGMQVIACTDCGLELSQEVIAKTGHKEKKETVDVTCTIAGKEIVRCETCGVLISEKEVPATGHSAGTPTVTKKATCTEDGLKIISCTGCGLELSQEVIPKTEHIHEVDGGTAGAHITCADCGTILSTTHIYTSTITKHETCTEAGQTSHMCACGYSYTTEIAAKGHIHEVDGGKSNSHIECADCGTVLSTAHSYTDTVTQEATCTDAGEMLHSCACGYSYTTEIAATGHTEEYVGTMNFHSQCETCGEVLSTTHTYTDTVIMEADCFDIGMINHECECGYSYTEETPALGHTNGTPTVTVEATCTTDGTRTTTCTVCGNVTAEETIPATGHTEVNGATADSHTECSICGDVLSTTHSYTDTVTQEATCTDTGSMKHTCTCGYSYSEEISALGHTDGTPTVTVEATCTTDGTRTTTCTVCGSVTAEETISATGHTEVNGAVADSHTECSTCGEVLSTTHSYTDTVTQEATCTDTGSIKHTCNCGYNYSEVIAATGHTEGTPSVITPATCDTDGQAEVYCEDCGIFLQYETLPATGHTKSDENASQTTCSTCGETMVDFNSTNFPDTGFYNSLKNDGVDENSDGILTGTELSKVHTIDFENVGIADATGLEHFTALQYLNLYDNAVSNVPCENLTALTYINLSNTSITSFDATKYPNLTSLYLSSTQISSLDLSNNPNLTTLHLTDCSNLTALDLSNNMALQTAELQFSGLTSFTLDGNTSITDLNLRCNALETISVTNCTSLTTLTMPNEHSCVVNSVDITGCTSLTSIDLNYVASTLQTFIADSSGLSGVMEFTSFQVLETVSLNNCASLIGLHMGYSSTLTTLNASNSGLAFVNLSGGDSITTLNVTNNRYIVETQNLYVDMSGVNYFYGDSIVQDSLSDGTFSDTSFSFYSTSDGSAISEITYTYDMGNGVTADFTVEIVSY